VDFTRPERLFTVAGRTEIMNLNNLLLFIEISRIFINNLKTFGLRKNIFLKKF
jgi:hypothetical protein